MEHPLGKAVERMQMDETVAENRLKEFTSKNHGLAVAECIEGLGCSVYADGEMLVWAGPQVEALVGIPLENGAVITNETAAQYFLLRWDGIREFSASRGPLSADELRAQANF